MDDIKGPLLLFRTLALEDNLKNYNGLPLRFESFYKIMFKNFLKWFLSNFTKEDKCGSRKICKSF